LGGSSRRSKRIKKGMGARGGEEGEEVSATDECKRDRDSHIDKGKRKLQMRDGV